MFFIAFQGYLDSYNISWFCLITMRLHETARYLSWSKNIPPTWKFNQYGSQWNLYFHHISPPENTIPTSPNLTPAKLPGHSLAKTCTSPWTSWVKRWQRQHHSRPLSSQDITELFRLFVAFCSRLRYVVGPCWSQKVQKVQNVQNVQASKDGESTAKRRLISCSMAAWDFPLDKSTASTSQLRWWHGMALVLLCTATVGICGRSKSLVAIGSLGGVMSRWSWASQSCRRRSWAWWQIMAMLKNACFQYA